MRAEVTNGLFAIARRQVDAIGAVVRAHERNVTARSRRQPQPTRFGRWSGRCARPVRSLLPTPSIGGSGRF